MWKTYFALGGIWTLWRLPRMQEVVGSNPTEGKICFSHFTPFYEVECEELFCKTNLKQKCIEINKNKNLQLILNFSKQ